MGTPYGIVNLVHERILIVATGPSVEDYDFKNIPPDVYVIAVNSAIMWLPCVDAFFSLDPSNEVRGLLKMRRDSYKWDTCNYFMAVPLDYGTPNARIKSHRAPRETGVTYLERLTGDGPKSARYKLAYDRGCIHTGNSAYGALGLAYHMQPKRVALVGLDCTSGGYAYVTGKPRDSFDHLPRLFESAAQQLKDHNIDLVISPVNSPVESYPKLTTSDAIEWLIK